MIATVKVIVVSLVAVIFVSHGAGKPTAPPLVKPGECAPGRPNCLPITVMFPPTTTCVMDKDCPSDEKCCFDICFNHHCCRPPFKQNWKM